MTTRLATFSVVLTMLACGSGLPKDPVEGILYFKDSGGVVHEYEVTEAVFNEYQDNDGHWLTIYIRANTKIGPKDSDNQMPWLEINIRFASSKDAVLANGKVLMPPAYDDSLGNLTNFYHWEHVHLEPAKVELIDLSNDRWLVQVSGATYDGPVVVKAALQRNTERERSFT